MSKICPICKSIAEYNAYYGRDTCTRCSWEGKPDTKRYIVKHKRSEANLKVSTHKKEYVKA